MTSRRRLIEAHRAAAAYYRSALLSQQGAGPRDYLVARHLGSVIDAPRWTIGFAPPGWTQVRTHLRVSGFTDTEILTAGLTVETRTGSLVDRFRDRIMLGIRDHNGDLIGFVGRCPPRASGDIPKYLNSPRTALFSKIQHLFGLAEQRDRLQAGKALVLVEGPLDVLALASVTDEFAGVSPCGTAISPVQAATLREHSHGGALIVAFDADEAGDRAARTAYERLAPMFTNVLAARMPEGHDPASLAAADPNSMRCTLQSAGPLADQLVDDVLRYYEPKLDNAEARVCALHESTHLIARLCPPDVARQVARVASRLGFSAAEVTADLLKNAGLRHEVSTGVARTAAIPSRTFRPRAARHISF